MARIIRVTVTSTYEKVLEEYKDRNSGETWVDSTYTDLDSKSYESVGVTFPVATAEDALKVDKRDYEHPTEAMDLEELGFIEQVPLRTSNWIVAEEETRSCDV